jgi:hypothetical protein
VRRLTAVLTGAVVAGAAGAGVGAWRLTAADAGPALPILSAYSLGQTVRTGPYLYCDVVDLEDCTATGAGAVLAVGDRDPVQISVPAAIGSAPWRLLRVYEDERDSTTSAYRPGTRLAVTVPTIDDQRGRLVGIVVHLMTLVQDPEGNLFDLPHAEWSVQLDWDRG